MVKPERQRKNKVEEEFKPFSFVYVGAKQEVPRIGNTFILS